MMMRFGWELHIFVDNRVGVQVNYCEIPEQRLPYLSASAVKFLY